jgi:hypothetical protein
MRRYSERISEILRDAEKLKKVGKAASQTLCRPWKTIVEEVKDRYIHLIKKVRLKKTLILPVYK